MGPGARPSPRGIEFWRDALLFLLPAVVIALHPLANNDLPLHLAIGEWILEHGTLPATDPFSCTAGGNPWVPHEWLAGVIFALVEGAAGPVGLVLAAALGAALLAAVHRKAMAALGVRVGPHLLWLVPLWLIAGRRLMLRPHLFALTLPFLLWWILATSRSHPRRLWIVLPVMLLWVNLHGSFLLGLGIIGLDLVVCGRWHPAPRALRYGVTLLAGLTLFTPIHVYFQPDLLAGLKHSIGLVSDPVFMTEILEWIPPLSSPDFQTTVAFWLSIPWTAAVVWGALRTYRGGTDRLPVAYGLFVMVTFLLYFRHQRFVALYVLASVPLLPTPRDMTRWMGPLRVATLLAAAGLAYPGFPVSFEKPPRRPGFRWASNLPISAVEALQVWEIQGGVLCEYDYGGTIMWKGQGRLRPTMDSRNSVYGAELFQRHQEALVQSTPFRRELLARVSAAVIRVERQDLIGEMLRDPRWLAVHRNGPFVALVKRP